MALSSPPKQPRVLEASELRARIGRHLAASKCAETRFGREAVNDPRLVSDLRAGRDMRPKLMARIAAYLDRVEQADG